LFQKTDDLEIWVSKSIEAKCKGGSTDASCGICGKMKWNILLRLGGKGSDRCGSFRLTRSVNTFLYCVTAFPLKIKYVVDFLSFIHTCLFSECELVFFVWQECVVLCNSFSVFCFSEHDEITKIDKNQNPRWPPAAILDFGLEAITFERFELDTSNLAHG